jgi:hypothetical protein
MAVMRFSARITPSLRAVTDRGESHASQQPLRVYPNGTAVSHIDSHTTFQYTFPPPALRTGFPSRDGGNAFGADYGVRPVVPLVGLGAFTLSITGGFQEPSRIALSGQ